LRETKTGIKTYYYCLVKLSKEGDFIKELEIDNKKYKVYKLYTVTIPLIVLWNKQKYSVNLPEGRVKINEKKKIR